MRSSRSGVPLAWLAFCGYAAALFIATHWPKLTIAGPPNTDKIIHTIVFALWTALFLAAGFFGEPFSRRNILAAALIAPFYAGLDELTQGFPGLGRTVALDDYLANLSGIIPVLLIALLLSKLLPARSAQEPAAP